MAVGDVDGDRVAEVVVLFVDDDQEDDTVAVLKYHEGWLNQIGRWHTAEQGGSWGRSFNLANLNGDQRMDVVLTTPPDWSTEWRSSLSILFNNGGWPERSGPCISGSVSLNAWDGWGSRETGI